MRTGARAAFKGSGRSGRPIGTIKVPMTSCRTYGSRSKRSANRCRGKEAGGRSLTVNEAKPKTEGGRGGGGRGGFNRGGGGGGGGGYGGGGGGGRRY